MRRGILLVVVLVLAVAAAWRTAAAEEAGSTTSKSTTTTFRDPARDFLPNQGGYPYDAEKPTDADGDDKPSPPPHKPGANTSTTVFRDPAADFLPNPGAYPYDAENPTDVDRSKDPEDPAGTKPQDEPSGGAYPSDIEQHGSGEDDGWGFDAIWGPVRRVIDGWFLDLARASLGPLLDLLGTTLFSTPDVTVPGTVRDYWSYTLAIANVVLLLMVVAAGLVLMGHETVQTNTTIKEVAPRVVFAVVAANASLGFAGMLIRAANALSAGLLGDFEPQSGHMATEGLIHLVLGIVAGGGIFLAILGLAVAALGIAVLCTYIARVATVVVLVGAAPLFLVAHAVPQLESAARFWWRALIGCLAVQVGQCLVMSMALRVFFHADGRSLAGMPGGGTMDLLLVGSLFWLMLRIPSYASRTIFSPRSSNRVMQQVGQRAVSRSLGAVTGRWV